MNRAERRALERRLRSQTGRLAHAAPESVTLRGGPMNGWVVKPDAPAFTDRFYPGLVESRAAGLYNASLSTTGETFAPPSDVRPWAELGELEREPFREAARAEVPAGRYVREGTRGRWEPTGA